MPLPHQIDNLWRLESEAADELAAFACPFADERFAEALQRVDAGWRVHTLGAVADDGARAALTVACKGHEGESIPFGYGGIQADRSLYEPEVTALLRLAARHLEVATLRSRYVPLPIRGRPAHAGGRVIASTAVVATGGGEEDLNSRLAKKARQSIRRAERAGVVVRASADPSAFLDIYAEAGRRFSMVYPAELIRLLAASGLGRVYEAAIDGDVVGGAFALTGSTDWMYWLAAERDSGRRAEAGYPIVARLLADASESGARFVNLGASSGLPGVAQFKRRMGSVDLPVIEHVVTLRGGFARAAVAAHAKVRSIAHRARDRRQRR